MLAKLTNEKNVEWSITNKIRVFHYRPEIIKQQS